MLSLEQLTEKVHLLKDLERKASDLETQINNIKDLLKEEMTERNVEELKGEDWVVSWTTVTSNRLDQKLLKANYQSIYESCVAPSVSRRFSVK